MNATDTFRHTLLNAMTDTSREQPREWNEALLKITEGRRHGVRRYNWSGDLVSYLLALVGVKLRCLNRKAVSGTHAPDSTIELLRAWAGDVAPLERVGSLLGPEVAGSKCWHPWDAEKGACADGYTPQCGDLLIHKGGNLVEMVVEVTERGVRVFAPAVFAEARMMRRNNGHFELDGVIDVSAMVPGVEATSPAPAPAPRARKQRNTETEPTPTEPTTES